MKKVLVLACLAIVIGCREEAAPASDGGVVLDGGTALDCPGVLACAAECADDACADECVERAMPDAIAPLTELVACVQREACGEDSECIQTRCAAELGACFGAVEVDAGVPHDGGVVVVPRDGGTPDAGSSPLPARIEGTTRDWLTFPGTTDMVDSNATIVFVRDDAAGAAGGFPIETHAFYRVQQITYRATYAGADHCTRSADETETFTDPPSFDNHLILERTAGSDGLHGYELSTALTVPHPAGMLIVCPPPIGTSTGSFNAEHHVSTGTSHPRGDGRTFVGSTTLSARNWSWDLHAVD